MNNYIKITVAGLVLLIACVNAQAQERLSDPYEIMMKAVDAIGGQDALRAETTLYISGSMKLMGIDMALESWQKRPGMIRQEGKFQNFKFMVGGNGEVWWETDPNGELTIKDDEAFRTRKQLEMLADEFEYLDPESEIFSLSYEGISYIDSVECYVVKMANSLNQDYNLMCIDVSTFLLKKEVEFEFDPDKETHTTGSDWREANGVMRAWRTEIVQHPSKDSIIITISEVKPNMAIDNSIFEVPLMEKGK